MDEEELEQPKQKINLGSFFEKVDSIEKVSNRALSQSSANFSIINNQKLIINSINVSIEALETKIRDIANYIIIEKKLEKDVEEDRLLEAQDKEQKEAMVERATSMMGQPVQEEGGAQPEQQKGGSLLGTLLKLGIAAFAIKFLWPAILPLAGGLLKGALAKFAAISIGGLGGILKGVVVSTLGGLGIFGLGKLFTNLGNSIKDRFDKLAEGAKNIVNNFKFGKDGNVDGDDSLSVEGGNKDSNLAFKDTMSDTLEDKDLITKKETKDPRIESEFDDEVYVYDTGEFGPDKEDKDIQPGDTYGIADGLPYNYLQQAKQLPNDRERLLKMAEMYPQDKERYLRRAEKMRLEIIDFDKRYPQVTELLKGEDKQYYENMKNYSVESVNNQSNIEVETKNKNLDLSMSDGSGDVSVEIEALNQRVDGIVASRTGENNKEQNSNLLVPQNAGRVSDASLKVAQADIPFIKVVKNNQLSTSPKSNGLPPEIAAMIS